LKGHYFELVIALKIGVPKSQAAEFPSVAGVKLSAAMTRDIIIKLQRVHDLIPEMFKDVRGPDVDFNGDLGAQLTKLPKGKSISVIPRMVLR
jgi:hypothetical protein